MGSIASYPARQLKRRRNEWMRRNLAAVALVLTATVVLGLVVGAAFLLSVPRPAAFYALGLTHASLVAVALHLLNAAFLAHDQEAIWQLRGAWGEDNTRTELQRATRKRIIWGWIDSVELQGGDIDHLVVTRRGGVVAIDSKWRNQITDGDVPAMARSARRSAVRAEGVLNTLIKRESGVRHRSKTKALSVGAAVVVWGAARSDVPGNAELDGVRFLDGRDLLMWLGGLDGHAVPQEAAKEVLGLLAEYRATVASA